MIALNTAPSDEPLTLDEIKAHLRVDSTTEDAYIDTLLKAARRHVEHITGRSLITQTWEYYLDEWPTGDEIEIPLPPLQSVTSVKYTDTSGTEATFSAASYTVDTDSEPGRIVLNEGYSWPSTDLNATNPIQIVFVSGYGDYPQGIPEDIKLALMLIISHWYENREPVIVGQVMESLPMAFDALITTHRMPFV